MSVAVLNKSRRVQMDLAPNSFERLNKLKDAVEATTYTEVMRDALRVYEYLVEMDAKGNSFFVKDADGNFAEVKIFA